VLPDRAEVAGGHDRVRRQPVDLGLVEQQEERAVAADAVLRVAPVEPGDVDPSLVQLGQPPVGALAQLGQLAELDRLGGAGLGARGRLALLEPVVAERALERPAVVLAQVDDAVRTGRDAVAAAVADVRLDDDRAELGAEQRAGRAHVEARGVGAVLADVRRHQPLHAVGAGLRRLVVARRRADRRHPEIGDADVERLLDERHVPPGGGTELLGVVVRHAGEEVAVLGHLVPLLAGHLARLAADAHRGVGEEAHPGRVRVVPGVVLDVVEPAPQAAHQESSSGSATPARRR